MILRILIGVGIGVALGALLGSTRSCETGGCPLTANPWRGGVYGGVMGLLLALSMGAPAATSTPATTTNQSTVQGAQAPDVTTLTSDGFDSFVAEGTVLVDFWSPMCGPCRRQLPILDEVSRQIAEGVRIGKVDLMEHPELAHRFNVQVVPTLVLLRDGREKNRFTGLQSTETLLAALLREQAEETHD